MAIKYELTNQIITSHAGLAKIGDWLNDIDFFASVNRVSRIKKRSGMISDYDIIKTKIGLICIGKPYYEAVDEYREDAWFKNALNLKKVPSSPILRQRLDRMPKAVFNVLLYYNKDILKSVMEDESTEIDGQHYLLMDFDVSPMDNSNSKKEGVSPTYKLFDGYAPMFGYLGSSGFMLTNQLREGRSHSNCEGSLNYIEENVERALSITHEPLLVRFDSGNDALENVLMMEHKERVFYLIKRNLRKELPSDWFKHAKAHAVKKLEIREGLIKYYAFAEKEVCDRNSSSGRTTLKILVIATEEHYDKHGQRQLIPEVSIDTYWTNLAVDADRIESLYHDHGTCEQYHSEFKTDLDMERLPSGKFETNNLLMYLGMIAFNCSASDGIGLPRVNV